MYNQIIEQESKAQKFTYSCPQ